MLTLSKMRFCFYWRCSDCACVVLTDISEGWNTSDFDWCRMYPWVQNLFCFLYAHFQGDFMSMSVQIEILDSSMLRNANFDLKLSNVFWATFKCYSIRALRVHVVKANHGSYGKHWIWEQKLGTFVPGTQRNLPVSLSCFAGTCNAAMQADNLLLRFSSAIWRLLSLEVTMQCMSHWKTGQYEPTDL